MTDYYKLMLLADAGNAKAQFYLSRLYSEGGELDKDDRKAFEWSLKAAEQGLVEAQLQIALEYVKQNDSEKAREWYVKAAGQGSALAQYCLGFMDMNHQAYDQAREWLTKSAESGFEEGQALLGEVYLKGLGCDDDYEKAADLSLKAAEKGNPAALRNLGVMLENGYYFHENIQLAGECYQLAAEKGDAGAKTNLIALQQNAAYPSDKGSLEELIVKLKREITRVKTENSAVKTGPKKRINDKELGEVLADLQGLVGLAQVKKDVSNLVNLIKINNLRQERGLPVTPLSMHLVFTGNPGTGKTVVARLIAEIYQKIGILSKGHLVETDRSGLVAGYVGQTAIKVNEIVKKAMGGILFIDEAYSLCKDEDADFGSEAIDTLLKLMEDNRDDLIVIVAGYTNEIESFLESNPGLRSRFNKYINFDDYSPDELLEITKYMCKRSGYSLSESAVEYARGYYQSITDPARFGNARGVRNMLEKAITRQADRLVALDNKSIDNNSLMELTKEDFEEV